jgi:hypothetical protein
VSKQDLRTTACPLVFSEWFLPNGKVVRQFGAAFVHRAAFSDFSDCAASVAVLTGFSKVPNLSVCSFDKKSS